METTLTTMVSANGVRKHSSIGEGMRITTRPNDGVKDAKTTRHNIVQKVKKKEGKTMIIELVH